MPVMRYLIRRIFHGLALLAGVSLLMFALTQLIPGDYFQALRMDPGISAGTIAALRSRYGLDQSLPVRYLFWLRSVASGDLGFSFAYNRAVASLLRPRILNTLVLTVTATVISWILAIPIGIWSAAARGNWLDRLCSTVTSGLLATPDLILALGFLFLAVRTGLLPAGGMLSSGSDGFSLLGKTRDFILHLLLPCSALTLAVLPVLVRHVRAGIVETLDAPFVRSAVARGITRRRILWRHIFPAAANPMISLFGLTIGSLLSTSLVIEVIMSWPGLGPLILEAILARDVYLVIGAVMFSTLMLLTGNLIADLLLFAVDPRVRRG